MTSRIRLAARGSATAAVGGGVKVVFDLNGTSDPPETLSPGVWFTIGGGPSPDVGGALLIRPEGAPETTAWAATDEFTVDAMVGTLPVAVRVTEYRKGLPFFNELVSASYECKGPQDAPTATPKVIVTPTPTPRLASTIDPARDVSGVWRGGINLVPATDQTCQWSGPLALTLQQTNGVVTGSADITLSKAKALQDGAQCDPVDAMRLNLNGTVSSSSIQFKAGEGGSVAFSGSYTSSLMSGTVEWSNPQGPGFRGCFQVSRSGAIADCGNPFVTPTPVATSTATRAPTATPTATRTATPTSALYGITVDSMTCTFNYQEPTGVRQAHFTVTASGTATGPQGASFRVSAQFSSDYALTTSGWTQTTTGGKRDAGQPEKATWTATTEFVTFGNNYKVDTTIETLAYVSFAPPKSGTASSVRKSARCATP